MMYFIWIFSWVVCQRGMMFFKLVAENTWQQTIGITIVALVAGYFSYNTWLLPVYVIWIISWAINCFKSGGIIAGIMVFIFHLWLYFIFLKKDQTN